MLNQSGQQLDAHAILHDCYMRATSVRGMEWLIRAIRRVMESNRQVSHG